MSTPWQPDADALAAANITMYQRWLSEERGVPTSSYAELWEWSVTNVEAFWLSIWDYFGIAASRPPDRVLGSSAMPGAVWFPGATLSYAEHIFRNKHDDDIAIVHASQDSPPVEMSWKELREETAQIAAGLRAAGIQPGDRVAALMPSVPETTAAFLACASLGAIWSSCSPDFGASSVVDRFGQIEPKVLLAVGGYRYGDRDFDCRDVVDAVQKGVPSIEKTFRLPYAGRDGNWDELATGSAELRFEQLPFAHPLWVLYSSGTTGRPKPIVHGQGGILLEHLKTLYLHFDLHSDDRLLWFTTTGWMMWNLLVSGLLTNAPIVLYDGSPTYPDHLRLWEIADQAGVTCFGTSAAFVHSSMKAGITPRETLALAELRSVGSTGSPLSVDGFRWVREQVGDVWLFSTSGGTDLCTAFVGGVPTLPVVDGELQAPSLGAKVEAFDEFGQPVVGAVGELVLTEPMPSMPLRFWGDEDGSRYYDSYFATYPGVWRHGDWIELTPRGSAIIHGRSDATINRGGVRMGSAEIYRAVLALADVLDALVVDVPTDRDSRLLLFVVLRDTESWTDALRDRIAVTVRTHVSPRHVPDEILMVPAIPRTLSGKILEIPIKRILAGVPPEEALVRDMVADPASLEPFLALASKRT